MAENSCRALAAGGKSVASGGRPGRLALSACRAALAPPQAAPEACAGSPPPRCTPASSQPPRRACRSSRAGAAPALRSERAGVEQRRCAAPSGRLQPESGLAPTQCWRWKGGTTRSMRRLRATKLRCPARCPCRTASTRRIRSPPWGRPRGCAEGAPARPEAWSRDASQASRPAPPPARRRTRCQPGRQVRRRWLGELTPANPDLTTPAARLACRPRSGEGAPCRAPAPRVPCSMRALQLRAPRPGAARSRTHPPPHTSPTSPRAGASGEGGAGRRRGLDSGTEKPVRSPSLPKPHHATLCGLYIQSLRFAT